MNGLRFSCGTITFALAMSVAPLLGADDGLAEAKRLYVAGQYENALAALSRDVPSASSDAEEYRVLCLLGLGRAADAEQIVERIVLRNPLATPDLEGRSPKFAATYVKVRKRILALVAPTMYGMARASFDAGNLAMASVQFKELVALLDKNESNGEPLSDLRMLADGFSRLCHRRVEALKPVAPPAPQVVPARVSAAGLPVEPEEIPVVETLIVSVSPPEGERLGAGESKPFSPWRPQVFGPTDVEVKPPVVVEQRMPVWVAPTGYANTTFRGTLEILVGESGQVTSVKSLERTHPLYDTMLLAAARQWRYEPAVKDGRPVPYRKTLAFTLQGR